MRMSRPFFRVAKLVDFPSPRNAMFIHLPTKFIRKSGVNLTKPSNVYVNIVKCKFIDVQTHFGLPHDYIIKEKE
jgi:hypothetical protein